MPVSFRFLRRRRGRRVSHASQVGAALSTRLLNWLSLRLGIPELRYQVAPEPVHGGWETYLYRFSLNGPDLPPKWAQPLMLRLHADRRGRVRARYEHDVPRFLTERGYSVPAPLLVEENCTALGGPFLIMEMIAGEDLARRGTRRPWAVFAMSAALAPPAAPVNRSQLWLIAKWLLTIVVVVAVGWQFSGVLRRANLSELTERISGARIVLAGLLYLGGSPSPRCSGTGCCVISAKRRPRRPLFALTTSANSAAMFLARSSASACGPSCSPVRSCQFQSPSSRSFTKR
jgi:hypothetical protein